MYAYFVSYFNNIQQIVQKMNSSGHSMVHESIYDSNNQVQRNSRGDFILESKVVPLQVLDSKKSNDMDMLKTGKSFAQNNLQHKLSLDQKRSVVPLRHTLSSKAPDNKPSIERNFTLQQSEKHPAVIDQAQFIMYYEQNIQLKNKQRQMQSKMQSMKNKLNEISQVRQRENHRELEMLAAGKKSAWDTKQVSNKKNKSTFQKDKDSAKVSNLLQIIDHYKSKLMTAQDQIQNLKRQKHLLQQDTRLKDKKNDQMLKDYQNTSTKVNTTDLEQKLTNTTKLLQIEKQRNKYNEADIKRMQTRIRMLQTNREEMQNLRQMNRNLQDQLMKLAQLPSFSKVTDKVDEQRKYKEIQQQNKSIKEKFAKMKNQNIKIQADSKLLRDQLIKAHAQCNVLEQQNMKLKQTFSGNAILSQLATEPELLQEVVYEIQKKKSKVEMKSELERQNYDKIILQKQMLANELSNLRNKMRALQQNWKEKERISRIQKEQLAHIYKEQASSSLRPEGKVMSKNGVAYTDDVSMFTQDTQNINVGNNCFDLFIGELHLLETMMATNFNIRGSENTLILATIDFYNHNTQTTRPVHGIHSNLQSQFSFKVIEDQFFFKYLNKGNFLIEIWGSEGNKRILLGRATVDLKPLIIKSRKNMAPVVASSIPLYVNQKVMGSLNFVMRLRLPIFQQLQKISELDQLVSTEEATVRRLIIQVQQGRGFPQNSNTFVYFPFRLEDYYTKTFKGSNPAWNYYKTIELKYNNDLKNYLRKNEIQFVVLDDSATLSNQGDSDVVGSAHVSLVPLLESKVIRDRVSVMKGTQRVGQIDIKIYWHQTQPLDMGVSKAEEIKSIEDIIHKFVTDNKLQPERLFYEIDKNRTGMISFEQFFTWVLKIRSGITLDMANIYYNQFKQPVNLVNFTSRLTASQHSPSQIAKQFSEINKMFLQNTQMIKKKQSLQDYLKDKDIMTVCLDIDMSQDGKISRQQLKNYFQSHNIEPPAQSYEKQQIQIVKLMKKYQSLK